MSPRAAWRLESLGFQRVFDYVAGKADWLARGLPREGSSADVPHAGDLADRDPPACSLDTPAVAIARALLDSRYGFCVVLNHQRVVLGRVRRSALDGAAADATAQAVMEPGPSTVRPNTGAAELGARLAVRGLRTAIVTTPDGRLLGVFHRDGAERV